MSSCSDDSEFAGDGRICRESVGSKSTPVHVYRSVCHLQKAPWLAGEGLEFLCACRVQRCETGNTSLNGIGKREWPFLKRDMLNRPCMESFFDVYCICMYIHVGKYTYIIVSVTCN